LTQGLFLSQRQRSQARRRRSAGAVLRVDHEEPRGSSLFTSSESRELLGYAVTSELSFHVLVSFTNKRCMDCE